MNDVTDRQEREVDRLASKVTRGIEMRVEFLVSKLATVVLAVLIYFTFLWYSDDIMTFLGCDFLLVVVVAMPFAIVVPGMFYVVFLGTLKRERTGRMVVAFDVAYVVACKLAEERKLPPPPFPPWRRGHTDRLLIELWGVLFDSYIGEEFEGGGRL